MAEFSRLFNFSSFNVYFDNSFFPSLVFNTVVFLYLFSFHICWRLCAVYSSLHVDLPGFLQSSPGHLQNIFGRNVYVCSKFSSLRSFHDLCARTHAHKSFHISKSKLIFLQPLSPPPNPLLLL